MLPINVFDQNMQSTGRFGFGAARAYVAAGHVPFGVANLR